MACAAQPLTLNALRHALSITLEEGRYDDYQPGRVPGVDQIRSICGSLITVDGSPSSDQAVVRFVHKSVRDFFKDGISRSQAPDDLRCFFVDEPAGNLELGRHCLKYLNYERYRGAEVDVDELVANAKGEHAFLPYAAAFWFQHLDGNVAHTEALFAAISDFVRGAAFGTYLAVQARVRPHMFARYTERCSAGYMTVTLQRGQSADDDSFAVPLPTWLELYAPDGPATIQAVHSYIKEWHEVLLLHPDATRQCVMLNEHGRRLLPGTCGISGQQQRPRVLHQAFCRWPGAAAAASSQLLVRRTSRRVLQEIETACSSDFPGSHHRLLAVGGGSRVIRRAMRQWPTPAGAGQCYSGQQFSADPFGLRGEATRNREPVPSGRRGRLTSTTSQSNNPAAVTTQVF